MKAFRFFEKVAENVIIHDRPVIIEKMARRLDNVRRVENHRYLVYDGEWKDRKVTLVATHLGAGSTAIVVDETADMGAKNIIKIGSFGAMEEGIKIGDFYLPEEAVRTDGVTEAYAPPDYKARPNGTLLKIAEKTAKEKGIRIRKGTIWSTNVYQPVTRDDSPDPRFRYDTWRGKAFGVEMETSVLFVCSAMKNVRSLAILVCNRDWETIDGFRKGKKVDWRKYGKSERHKKSTEQAIDLALSVIERAS